VLACAGNTPFTEGIASLKYAVGVLGVPLIVLLVHQGCGAVSTALSEKFLNPELEKLVGPIRASLVSADDVRLLEIMINGSYRFK
jgi:carbonic anhydrase